MHTAPRFHAPAVFGVRPGNAFFLALPVEGEQLSLHCENPPPGTAFNPVSGALSGRIAAPGTYPVKFAAENSAGRARCEIRLIAGEEIQLTPPMGWNSWYCFSEGVSDARIRETAAAMKERGLAAHGWNQINIDDCWQGKRGGRYGALQGNERFPDMAALAHYIHSFGLRFGIYSTPWIGTYAGFRGGSTDGGDEERLYLKDYERLQLNQVFGRYPALHRLGVSRTGSEWRFDRDIRQWAEWGVDFVKVDWHPNDLPTTRRIARELRHCGRDLALSLSNNAPTEQAAELAAAAQLWRITGDIHDTWESISAIGFDHPAVWHKELRPGHYPDPDMLQIGAIGLPNRPNIAYTPSRLSHEEQKLQFALWCLLSAPLLLSCDIAGMDEETFRLLTNDELIAINQDHLVAPPHIEDRGEGVLLYRKPLANGGEAVALFNRSDEKRACRLDFEQRAKDLWSGEECDLSGDFALLPHTAQVFRTAGKRKEERQLADDGITGANKS